MGEAFVLHRSRLIVVTTYHHLECELGKVYVVSCGGLHTQVMDVQYTWLQWYKWCLTTLVFDHSIVLPQLFREPFCSKLEKVQRKAARFIFNSYSRRASPTALLHTTNLESLAVRRYRERLKTFYLLYHHKFRIDTSAYITRLFVGRHARTTRKKSAITHAKLNLTKIHFFPRTAREWNLLPAHVVQCPDVSSFMHELPNPPKC